MTNLLVVLISLLTVNPFIGSGGHGHVFVGANVPHGEVCAGPMNRTLGWDWCSGYHDGDYTLAGFAQTRLSGTGVADYGDILLLPQICADSAYVESFSKQVCRPGYYSAMLDGSGISAEMTASEHCALYRFSYPEGSEAYLKIDLTRGAQSLLFRKAFVDGEIRKTGKRSVEGKRVSSEWTFDQPVWFAAEFSAPVKSFESDGNTYAIIGFGKLRRPLEVKVAVSQNGAQYLKGNLKETKGFKQTLKRAESLWTRELGKIEFQGYDAVQDTIFNTALYHTAFAPQLISDAGQPTEYSIFSLWDTYRAVHPLFNLIDERSGDYCNSLLDIYDRTGRLPVWQLGHQDTDCMVGVHSISVLCEAALKGVEGVDARRVLDACSHMLEQPTYGMNIWDEYGYLPADKVNWSVSVELEYCINAYCIALLAEQLGETELSREFYDRAMRYTVHFDHGSGFMRGVDSQGRFTEPFDPSFSLHEKADYVEGNSWQYTFLVPWDVDGMASLYGGHKGLEAKLDGLFSADSTLNEGASNDITGMIGQYAHGNEPSHHIIYLYTLLGRPDKAAELLRRVYSEFYSTSPDGLIGNEDCGQMSAWYVFSALGFYPVNPCDGRFVFGSPLCRKATVHLVNGNTLNVSAPNNSAHTPYIKEVRFNGKVLDRPYITYEELMQGGLLEYKMSAE